MGVCALLKIRMASLTRQLFHGFEFARSQAIKLNEIVRICGTEDFKKTCALTWNRGYIVFTDKGNHRFIHYQAALSISLRLPRTRFPSLNLPLMVDVATGTLTLSHQKQKKHEIVLYDSGRLRMR